MRQLFLPLGLIVAIIVARLIPAGGIFISENNGLRIIVFIIFLVSGYQTGGRGITLDKKLFVLFGCAAFISLYWLLCWDFWSVRCSLFPCPLPWA